MTARELYRHAAAVLDEVERNGRHVVISRYGRAVAFIGPIPEDYVPTDFERLHVAPQFHGTAPLDAAEDLPTLDDGELAVLGEIAATAPDWWNPRTTEEEARTMSPLFWLQELGLVTSRSEGGWQATDRGIRAASRT
ncbi:MAG: type II toxin-antitoxin system Phd/YefM family antitoxin [Actinomycetota bacterium]